MQRDLTRMAASPFDVLVIGAGIHGACAARDAALRGLRVALVERGDFGGETSHNSLKTVHGGIRYIQHLNFARTRASIREQTVWLRTAPHLVRPLPFLMPTFGHGMRGPGAMFAGVQLYRMLGLGRNGGLGAASRIRPGRVMGPAAARAIVGEIPGDGLTGAALWDDAQIRFADRAILEILGDAVAHGAQVANHAEVTDLLQEGGRVTGGTVQDRLTGETHEIAGRVVLNAAGPWVGDLAGDLPGHGARLPLTRSMNIVTRRPARDVALSIQSNRASDSKLGQTKRLYFEIPWEGCAMFGTTHAPAGDGPDTVATQQAEIATFIAELNAAWPGLDLELEDVTYCYRGLTPAEDAKGGQSRSHESRIIDHGARGGLQGLWSIIGVKWTTGRLIAVQAVDAAAAALGHGTPGRTHEAALPPLPDMTYEMAGKSPDAIRQICLAHMERTQTLTLRDMLLRRTDDLVRGHLQARDVAIVAHTMRAHLGWTPEACARQTALMLDRWLPAATRQIFKAPDLFESTSHD